MNERGEGATSARQLLHSPGIATEPEDTAGAEERRSAQSQVQTASASSAMGPPARRARRPPIWCEPSALARPLSRGARRSLSFGRRRRTYAPYATYGSVRGRDDDARFAHSTGLRGTLAFNGKDAPSVRTRHRHRPPTGPDERFLRKRSSESGRQLVPLACASAHEQAPGAPVTRRLVATQAEAAGELKPRCCSLILGL